MSARSSLDLDSDPKVIEGVRVFDAPPELVFSCFADPKHIGRWWGPDGFTQDPPFSPTPFVVS